MSEDKLVGIFSPPYEDSLQTKVDGKGVGGKGKWNVRTDYGDVKGQIGSMKSESQEREALTMNIDSLHTCSEEIEWHGMYASEKKFKKYLDASTNSHPAKGAMLLYDKIFKHLEQLGLLKKDDCIVDFMGGTGRTNVLASIHGYKSISVELETHFIKMQEKNKEVLKKRMQKEPDWKILQGDARKLSEILDFNRHDSVGIVSPPYADMGLSAQSSKNEIEKRLKNGIAGATITTDGKYMTGSGKYMSDYSKNKANISNLKDTELVGITSPPYSLGEGIRHGGKVTKLEIEKRIQPKYGSSKNQIGNMNDRGLIGITSPPYEDSTVTKDMEFVKKLEDQRGSRFQAGSDGTYGQSAELLGTLKAETYTSAMLQVYQEAFKSGISPLVTVTKNPTKQGKLRRLDLDTARLLELAGYTIIDYHKATLFDVNKTRTITGTTQKLKETKKEIQYEENIKRTLDGKEIVEFIEREVILEKTYEEQAKEHHKTYNGRLSFFKRLSAQKGNVVADHEDIIIAVIKNRERE